MRIDSHVHLYERRENIWIAEKIGGLARDFTLNQLEPLLKSSGIGSAVLVQSSSPLDNQLRWFKIVEHSPLIAGVVALTNFKRADLRENLEFLQGQPKFVGVRPLPDGEFPDDAWLQADTTWQGLRMAEELHCNVDLMFRVESLTTATRVLSRLGQLKVCLNHAGRPAPISGITEPWASDLRRFAAETSAVVKLSNLVERGGVEWSLESIKPYVAKTIEVFGANRVMFGTNWPVLEVAATYGGWVSVLLKILDSLALSRAEVGDIMGGTAARFYGVGVSAAGAGEQS
jgi:L-fuconolactonase